MFLVNSRPGLVTATPFCEGAPLLPKLRGYFAEFLRESCLAPLGILYLPTCVGFGYRYPFVEGRSSFSWEYGIGYILQRRSAWYEPRGEAIASPRGSYFSAADQQQQAKKHPTLLGAEDGVAADKQNMQSRFCKIGLS